MEKETKTIKLSKCEVDIKTSITWGESQEIESVLMTGAKVNQEGLSGFDAGVLLESKYKLLEIVIKEIRTGDKKMQFTREWMANLSIEDGDKLYERVDELTKKK